MNVVLNWLARCRMIVGGALCLFLLLHLLWKFHWLELRRIEYALLAALLYFAPAAVVAWAVSPRSVASDRIYRRLRNVILLHAALAVIAAIAIGKIEWVFFALFGALIDLAVVGLGSWRQDSRSIVFYRRSVLLLTGIPLLGLMAWSFANIGIVAWNAERLAAGRPYCLQTSVDKGGGYRAVGNLLALNGLAMRAPYYKGYLQLSFHAVLSIQGDGAIEWYNWSYRNQRFMRLPGKKFEDALVGMREPECQMQPKFIRLLPGI